MSESDPRRARPAVRFLDRKSPPHIATLVAVTGLSALAINIFLPSLPAMAKSLSADPALMPLTVSLYLAASALLQLCIGPVSDRFGRRSVLLWCLVLFLVATVGTILAQSLAVLLFFRMMQAVVAVGMALSRAVIRDMVPMNEAASMIGYVTMGMAFIPMVGPMIGGLLDEALGWRASFVLLFVLGLAVLAMVWLDLGETSVVRPVSFAEQVRQYPYLLKSPRFWGYSLSAAFASGSYFAYLGGAPLVGTKIFGLPPGQLGLYLGAPAVGYAAGNYLSGRFATRIGVTRMIFIGNLVTAVGVGLLVLLSLAGLSGPLVFFGLVITVGLGNGIALPGANAGMLSVRPDLAGAASGLGGAMTIGGGAALSALAGWVLTLGEGDAPLALLMLACALAAMAAILMVIRRERRLSR